MKYHRKIHSHVCLLFMLHLLSCAIIQMIFIQRLRYALFMLMLTSMVKYRQRRHKSFSFRRDTFSLQFGAGNLWKYNSRVIIYVRRLSQQWTLFRLQPCIMFNILDPWHTNTMCRLFVYFNNAKNQTFEELWWFFDGTNCVHVTARLIKLRIVYSPGVNELKSLQTFTMSYG